MTIAEKLQQVNDIKGQIQDAVNQKGGEIPSSMPFADYPAGILGIPQEVTEGGGGMDVYSTEEQVIGTWIDGRPIYRICISISNYSNSVYGGIVTAVTIPNMDVIVNARLNYIDVAHGRGVLTSYVQSESQTDTISFTNSFPNISVSPTYVGGIGIVEYTKTTDEAIS